MLVAKMAVPKASVWHAQALGAAETGQADLTSGILVMCAGAGYGGKVRVLPDICWNAWEVAAVDMLQPFYWEEQGCFQQP